LAVDAVGIVAKADQAVDIGSISIRCLDGNVLASSRLVRGLVVQGGRVSTQTTTAHVNKANVALIQFSFDQPRTSDGFKVVVHDSMQLDRLIRDEERYIKGIVAKFKRAGMWWLSSSTYSGLDW
jgi:chaperonin GroEL (HSP60 family)